MENLRYERQLTQEEYLHGIVSTRQYFRYRNNESEAPFETILRLSERLGIPIFRLFSQYEEDHRLEASRIQDYFNLVIQKKTEEANQMEVVIQKHPIFDVENKRFFLLAKLMHEYNLKLRSKSDLVSNVKEITGFETLLKNASIHDIELYMLGLVMEYSDTDRERIVNHIISWIARRKLMTSGNPLYTAQVYFWLIKNLGRLKRYSEVILLADEAIQFCNQRFSHYTLEYFHYYKALACKNLGDTERYEHSLYHTICVLLMKSADHQAHFHQMIRDDLGVDSWDFLRSRIP
jgi:transcriptional regulator with XRE-family HTH domain